MTLKLRVAAFHPGTQHSWQTARALQELGRLEFFATSLFNDPARWPYRLGAIPGSVGARLRREFSRYTVPGVDPALIRSGGGWEWVERICGRLGLGRIAGELDLIGNRRFVKQIAREIESERQFALWGYNNSALESFELGKRHGRMCVLDRTIGDWRAFDREMLGLQDRYGDWFEGEFRPTDPRIIAREDAEYALADRIVVGCEFARQTVLDESSDRTVGQRLEVLHYGYDSSFDAVEPLLHDKVGPVRFLFAGLGIPRKGIHHALEAIARFPRSEAELTVLGSIGVPDRVFTPYADRITHIPTTPRHEVPSIMARHDVLIFPTYFEGAGIVLYEALASGMALIQTDRAAVAVTPETGILLPRPDTDELTAAMEACIADRDQLAAWQQAARPAAQAYRSDGYMARIEDLLTRIAA